jgi:hypothetical protein
MDLPLDEPLRAARQYFALSALEVKAAFQKWIRPDGFVEVGRGPGRLAFALEHAKTPADMTSIGHHPLRRWNWPIWLRLYASATPPEGWVSFSG